MSLAYESLRMGPFWLENTFAHFSSRDTIYWAALDTTLAVTDVSVVDPWERVWTYSTTGHGNVESDFIRNVFLEIDKIIEPQFIEVSPDAADLVIISTNEDIIVDSKSGNKAAGLGIVGVGVDLSQDRLGAAIWRDSSGEGDLTAWERHVIVHEVGHVLGLSHPGAGDEGGSAGGYDPAWSNKDSIMSYNSFNGDISQFFSPLDTLALQSIWGAESDKATPGWPATAYFPATEQPKIDNSLVQELSDEGVLDYPMYADKEITFYIDTMGVSKLAKPLKKQGKLAKIGLDEAAFAREIFELVDGLTGLNVKEVGRAKDADLVFGSLRKKKRWKSPYGLDYGWDAHIKSIGTSATSVIYSRNQAPLGDRARIDIAQAILWPIGLWDYVEVDQNTSTTVMSKTGETYRGLTINDIAALQSLWGTDL